jgi:hypothetical protein
LGIISTFIEDYYFSQRTITLINAQDNTTGNPIEPK